MQRRKLLLLMPVAPLSLYLSRHLGALGFKARKPPDLREQALELNRLATSIRAQADADLLVDFVANLFAQESLPGCNTREVRRRVAGAEFASVSGQKKLISERQLVQAWNSFAQAIGAPRENQVVETEVHNLRDAFFATANFYWQQGSRNVWQVPGIYAVNDHGELADGCRAIESLRILWDLANSPDNLSGARARIHQKILVSDQLRELQNHPTQRGHSTVMYSLRGANPFEVAVRNFVERNGRKGFGKAVSAMLDQALA